MNNIFKHVYHLIKERDIDEARNYTKKHIADAELFKQLAHYLLNEVNNSYSLETYLGCITLIYSCGYEECAFKIISDDYQSKLVKNFYNVYCDNKNFISVDFYELHKKIFHSSLHGLGILNYENDEVTGEKMFLSKYLPQFSQPVIFDVGANEGGYSSLAKSISSEAQIFAFEPHPRTFSRMKVVAHSYKKFAAFNLALSDSSGKAFLFDRDDHPNGSGHASLFEDVIQDRHKRRSVPFEVSVTTLDEFLETYSVETIHLLKIDTEGNEYAVLKGASNSLSKGIIKAVHFEFNEMNVHSRVFMKDFFDILKGYKFFRMLPDGLVEFTYSSPIEVELFAFQNIVALKED